MIFLQKFGRKCLSPKCSKLCRRAKYPATVITLHFPKVCGLMEVSAWPSERTAAPSGQPHSVCTQLGGGLVGGRHGLGLPRPVPNTAPTGRFGASRGPRLRVAQLPPVHRGWPSAGRTLIAPRSPALCTCIPLNRLKTDVSASPRPTASLQNSNRTCVYSEVRVRPGPHVGPAHRVCFRRAGPHSCKARIVPAN